MNFDVRMLERYKAGMAQTVDARTGCLTNSRLVDGIVQPASHPTILKRTVTNGHHRVRTLKFQMIVIPNGLIVSLSGPVKGNCHDAALLRMSKVAQHMRTQFSEFCVHDDPVYPAKSRIQAPNKGVSPTAQHTAYTKLRISKMRMSVEWMFDLITVQWTFLDFKKKVKILRSPVSEFYIVGGLLANCLICTRGKSPATSKFGTVLLQSTSILIERNGLGHSSLGNHYLLL